MYQQIFMKTYFCNYCINVHTKSDGQNYILYVGDHACPEHLCL
uniref:Uncharacterized protein n=1 Tax=Triticum urartu TaxID=4572 RepID=A0A8R7UEP9_TRIUA